MRKRKERAGKEKEGKKNEEVLVMDSENEATSSFSGQSPMPVTGEHIDKLLEDLLQ
jgi:hypothetical protein